jgi:hypothetical protein
VLFIAVVLTVIVFSSITASAYTDAENPNRQITSSSTQTDLNSWIRFSAETLTTFKAIPSSHGDIYSYQLNALLNGCSYAQAGCTWWMQAVPEITNTSNGYFVDYEYLWVWNGGNYFPFCELLPPYPHDGNINQGGWWVVTQVTLKSSTQVSVSLLSYNPLVWHYGVCRAHPTIQQVTRL